VACGVVVVAVGAGEVWELGVVVVEQGSLGAAAL
jgi:hypothetical protein